MNLLDTFVIIELDRGDSKSLQRAAMLDENGPHAIGSVTIFEFLFGIFLRYKSAKLRKALEEAEEYLSAFVILPLDWKASRRAAEIAARLRASGAQIGIQDVYLAAIALENDLILITKNPDHFKKIPNLKVEVW